MLSPLPSARALLIPNPLTRLTTWGWGVFISSGLSPSQCSLSCASCWLFPAAVVKNPPNNLWIIAAVLAPIAVVTVIIIIITAVLCRKNKNDFKPDTVMNLPQRAKVRNGSRRTGAGPQPAGCSAFLFSLGFGVVASTFRNILTGPDLLEGDPLFINLCV